MATERYFEDFSVGQTFGSDAVTVNVDQIIAFANEFDPQPFHLDESEASSSVFGGLVASGWHTAALTMRLLVASELKIAGGIIGAGVDEVKWPQPVRPGDTLHLELEVIGVRPSKSRPMHGIVRVSVQTLNSEDHAVQTVVLNLLVPRERPATHGALIG